MRTRPTADRVREALFSILFDVQGSTVLDLYAGTGAIGIEAISRGAAMVTFVESDRRAQTLIAENVAHCGVESGYAIIRATVARAIDDYAPLFAFAMATGMRQNECLLRWSEVDLDKNVVDLGLSRHYRPARAAPGPRGCHSSDTRLTACGAWISFDASPPCSRATGCSW